MQEQTKLIVIVCSFVVIVFLAYSIGQRNEMMRARELRALNLQALPPGQQQSSSAPINIYENGGGGGGSGGGSFFPFTAVAIPAVWGAYNSEPEEENNVNVSRSAEINQYDRNGEWNRQNAQQYHQDHAGSQDHTGANAGRSGARHHHRNTNNN